MLVLVAAFLLFACKTTELTGITDSKPRATPTRARTAAPKVKPTTDPEAGLIFMPLGTPRCGVGDNNASVVRGRITENNAPVEGQRVTASSGPGAEPISDEPAVTNAQGNYQVTFVCDGKACDGAFWIWTVDEEFQQTSPFVQFTFDKFCRSGTLNFRKR